MSKPVHSPTLSALASEVLFSCLLRSEEIAQPRDCLLSLVFADKIQGFDLFSCRHIYTTQK